MKLPVHFQVVSMLRMDGDVPPFPHKPSWRACGHKPCLDFTVSRLVTKQQVLCQGWCEVLLDNTW